MRWWGIYHKWKKWTGKGYDEFEKIIYELNDGNGKVKEYYDNDKLKFEGEYLNGKRNGKGKEYYDGILIFEGEYLNDKEWIGNRYDWNGNILYKLNDNINGNGKEYYDIGKLKFEGEYR